MYKCIYGFSVDMVDADGFSIENEHSVVKEGTIWNIPGDKDYRFIGGEIRLENEEFGWIEIPRDMFETFFEEVLPHRMDVSELNKLADEMGFYSSKKSTYFPRK